MSISAEVLSAQYEYLIVALEKINSTNVKSRPTVSEPLTKRHFFSIFQGTQEFIETWPQHNFFHVCFNFLNVALKKTVMSRVRSRLRIEVTKEVLFCPFSENQGIPSKCDSINSQWLHKPLVEVLVTCVQNLFL